MTVRLLTFLFLYSCFFLRSTLLRAENATPVELDEVVIDVHAVPQSSKDSTSAATVISIPQQNNTQDLPALLQSAPGVNITRIGSHDSYSAVSLRGSSHGQVNFYLNSIPLSDAQSSFNAWDLFPSSFLESVEIYRGSNPGKLVDSSAGGSIVFLTKPSSEKKSFAAHAGYGSFQSINFGANLGGKHFRLLLDHERSKGDFSFLDSNGTYSNSADDQVIDRINNDFATTRATGELSFRLKKSELSVHNFFLHKNEGIPGFASPQATSTKLRTIHNLLTLEHSIPNLTKQLKLDSAAFADLQWQHFSDPLSEIGLGNQATSDYLLRLGTQTQPSWTINRNNILTPFLAYRSEIFLSEDENSAGSASTSLRHKLSSGIESEHYFLHDRLLLNPSARAELLLSNFSLNDSSNQQYSLGSVQKRALQFSGKIGLSAKLSSSLTLQSNVGSGFRPPSFSELFGDRGTLSGNPGLVSEKSIDADLGLVFDKNFFSTLEHLHVETFFFNHYVNHLIQFVQTSQLTAQAMNLSKADIYGIENSLSLQFTHGFSSSLAYTLQEAKDISGGVNDGLYLPGRPQHLADLSGNYEKKWQKNFSTQLNTQLHFTSGNFLDTQNFLLAERRFSWDAGLKLIAWQHTTLNTQFKNILNNRTSDLVGYPLPGRNFSIGVNYEM